MALLLLSRYNKLVTTLLKINRLALAYKEESDPVVYQAIFNNPTINHIKHLTFAVASRLTNTD